jgi:hypothetical protein
MRQDSDLWAVNHVSVSIDRPAADVYAFVSDPANVPAWATGLAGTITRVGDDWIADSPLGKVKVRFADKNAFGVLDHDVTLPSGVTLRNPMRVIPNDRGSEVVFTLFRRPGVSEAKFADDATWVARDLRALKALLEGRR